MLTGLFCHNQCKLMSEMEYFWKKYLFVHVVQ
jgi:hypothetical protein